MKNILLISLLLILFSFNASSQDKAINIEAIDNYKYIIIPKTYNFLEEEDKYQINSLTKFLFNKYGYIAFLENESFPDDLNLNRCLALKADVVRAKGGFLDTRLQINLMDCNNIQVASSRVGKTREKEFKVAYNLALRDAFTTFQLYNYNYKPDPKVVTSPSKSNIDSTNQNSEDAKIAQDEIERLKEEVAALKEAKQVKKTVIKAVIETPSEESISQKPKEVSENSNILYAQPIENGFQVVDSSPKVIMILLETPKEHIFIVKDQNAIVYKEDGFWYLSKNNGKTTSIETLNIKF